MQIPTHVRAGEGPSLCPLGGTSGPGGGGGSSGPGGG
jgi:hypothetical protein